MRAVRARVRFNVKAAILAPGGEHSDFIAALVMMRELPPRGARQIPGRRAAADL